MKWNNLLFDGITANTRGHFTRRMSARYYLLWRRGGLVVSALNLRSGGRWFEPSLCRRVVSLDKKLYSTLSLFTQVYKWAPAIIMPGAR